MLWFRKYKPQPAHTAVEAQKSRTSFLSAVMLTGCCSHQQCLKFFRVRVKVGWLVVVIRARLRSWVIRYVTKIEVQGCLCV